MKDNKILLSIDLVKPGMVTAEAVINKYGNVLIWENIILNDNMISHLQNIGVSYITVYNEEYSYEPNGRYANDSMQFNIKYERDVDNTKQIFQDISAGRSLNVDTANQIVNSVLEKEQNNKNIIDSVMQTRNTDEYTYYHSLNVSMLCMMMGKWLRLDDLNVKNLTQVGLLHDIGKTRVPFAVLNKPAKLTDVEFEEIKRHSQLGYELITANSEIHPEVATAVLTHHEKEDGSGYPFGITGNKLNLYSKIVTIADIFDAMTANRSYRVKDTPLKVFELMQHGSFGVLDPVVLKVFLDNITNYYVGAKIVLNTGEMGEVVYMNNMDFSKPVVMVNNRYIDTLVSKNVIIEEFL